MEVEDPEKREHKLLSRAFDCDRIQVWALYKRSDVHIGFAAGENAQGSVEYHPTYVGAERWLYKWEINGESVEVVKEAVAYSEKFVSSLPKLGVRLNRENYRNHVILLTHDEFCRLENELADCGLILSDLSLPGLKRLTAVRPYLEWSKS